LEIDDDKLRGDEGEIQGERKEIGGVGQRLGRTRDIGPEDGEIRE